tara:strand:- start:20767 stop:21033 length:267 start_codon:yes stop_codon:yes gene_type:complete
MICISFSLHLTTEIPTKTSKSDQTGIDQTIRELKAAVHKTLQLGNKPFPNCRRRRNSLPLKFRGVITIALMQKVCDAQLLSDISKTGK